MSVVDGKELFLKAKVVVWLVRDTVRVTDNPVLCSAEIEARRQQAVLITLACLEPRRWVDQQYGLDRIGCHWARFRAQSLVDLRRLLQIHGGSLWASAEDPVDAVTRIGEQFSVQTIITDFPLSTEERLENASLTNGGYRVVEVATDELFQEGQLPFEIGDLPATFSKFRKVIERKSELVPFRPVAVPLLSQSPAQSWPDPVEWLEALQFKSPLREEVTTTGGETAAFKHWQNYLGAKALSHYKITRNSFFGPMQSSHLSAWLSHGCISPRQIWWDILEYEMREGANESTYWLRFELLWREFFRWYSRVHDWNLFCKSGPAQQVVSGDHNQTRFRQWTTGMTGCDVVDASMRELNATGWMSNRGRQLVASQLIYELNLDWRLGAAYFESRLVDYDVASNWGNWAYIAGVGPDPRGGRIFNLNEQAERYDPDRCYRSNWLP